MIWVAWISLIASLILGFGAFFGAPYLPILTKDRDELLDALAFGPGQTLLDLGSGDGTMLLAAAKRGGQAIGIEINPFWWLVSVLRTVGYRKQVTVQLGNFWQLAWPEADIVYVFLIGHYTTKLAQRARQELQANTQLVSFGFSLPDLEPEQVVGAAYIYRFSQSRPKVAEPT